MADLLGEVIPLDTPSIDDQGVVALDGNLADPFSAGAFVYLMNAKDSVTSALYSWTLRTKDLSGVGYPGPNAATEVCIAGRRSL